MDFDFPLNPEHAQRYARIIEEGACVRRHYDLLIWLQGEIQSYLPHEIMLAACGDFNSGFIRYDLISALLGIRTDCSNIKALAPLLQGAFNRWVHLGKAPYILGRGDSVFLLEEYGLQCALGVTLRGMRSALIHGVSDKRGQEDSLYIAFSSNEKLDISAINAMRFLLPYLDMAMGQMELAARNPQPAALRPNVKVDVLTEREEGLISLIKAGKTNVEIEALLQISPIALKSQLRNMFRKLYEPDAKNPKG
ncbi:MAG TPA: XrtB/PEP-CTERM-associated transcriptional regulator EpsA [Nitrosospira sp.]|nr:XrtB/PEP-CTERM-associated transcriptional regulator EpsA [Nitrosospira sp.]